jgi:hypothetical protein
LSSLCWNIAKHVLLNPLCNFDFYLIIFTMWIKLWLMNRIAGIPWNPHSVRFSNCWKSTSKTCIWWVFLSAGMWNLLRWFILNVHGIAVQELTLYQGSTGSVVKCCV